MTYVLGANSTPAKASYVIDSNHYFTATNVEDALAELYAKVGTVTGGLDWQESVIDKDLTAPPGGESGGERYIVASPAIGDWTGKEDCIAEYNAEAGVYVFMYPDDGTACWVEDEDTTYVYSGVYGAGGLWVKLGTTIDHGNLQGLADDDHTQYLLVNGTRALSGDWAVGSHAISGVTTLTASSIISTTGTSMGINTDGAIDETSYLRVGLRANFGYENGYAYIAGLAAKGVRIYVNLTTKALEFATPSGDATFVGAITLAGALSGIASLSMSGQLTNTLAIGTAPFVITSTTLNTNLNADLWDGYQFADYLNQDVKTTASPIFAAIITSTIKDSAVTTALSFDGAGTKAYLETDYLYFKGTTGDKISLYTDRKGLASMYGFGVEASALYYISASIHRWYANAIADAGVSDIMELDASGNLTITGSLTAANIVTAGNVDGIDISATLDQAVKTTSSPSFTGIYNTGLFYEHYYAVNDGNPEMLLGSSGLDELIVQAIYNSGTQELDSVVFETLSSGGDANDGRMLFYPDGTLAFVIDKSEIITYKNMRGYNGGTMWYLHTDGTASFTPSGTGSLSVVTITPSASIAAASNWYSLYMNLSNLDPATGAASAVYGIAIDGRLASADNNANVRGYYFIAPTADNSQAIYVYTSELTANVTSIGFYEYSALALSASATYQGVLINWAGITRDAGSPVLQGVEALLPADYTNFGANTRAAFFQGDGRTVTICDTSYSVYATASGAFDNYMLVEQTSGTYAAYMQTHSHGSNYGGFRVKNDTQEWWMGFVNNTNWSLYDVTNTKFPIVVTANTGAISVIGQIISSLVTGTSPFSVSSTTVNANLNADLWDGYQFADYLNQDVKTTASPIFAAIITSTIKDSAVTTALSFDGAGAIDAIGNITAAIHNLADNSGLYTGAGDDLRLYHDGTNSYIENATGILYIDSVSHIGTNVVNFVNDLTGIFYIRDADDADVVLFNFDTTNRTFEIGLVADAIATTFNGDVTVANLITVGNVDGVDVSTIVSFKTITGITNDVVADSLTDTLTLASGNNILGIVGTAATDTITFTIDQSNIDHGSIAGLGDDDHTQYLLVAGTRAMTGNLDMGTFAVTNVGNVDGVDVSALKSDVDGFPDELKNLVTAEIQQLENIGATTISAAQWGYLGALDQSLAKATSPTFVGVTLTGAIATPTTITTSSDVTCGGDLTVSGGDVTVGSIAHIGNSGSASYDEMRLEYTTSSQWLKNRANGTAYLSANCYYDGSWHQSSSSYKAWMMQIDTSGDVWEVQHSPSGSTTPTWTPLLILSGGGNLTIVGEYLINSYSDFRIKNVADVCGIFDADEVDNVVNTDASSFSAYHIYYQSLTPHSSARYKEGIESVDLDDMVSKLNGVQPKWFRFKNNPERINLGFVAEELPKELQSTHIDEETGSEIVDGYDLTGMLAAAYAKILSLERRIEKLENAS